MYSAAKHAVKGFTDALRMELEHAGAPISVTLIKPASIATPYPEHAGNVMDTEPTLPPPSMNPASWRAASFTAPNTRDVTCMSVAAEGSWPRWDTAHHG
ncbi:hypothetical protein HSBAA_31040 [Vreelandella sulfidaeris]|uniref:Short-chain dehydrogenase n=1 Tax=Vreelandella sulfidaeris TaxID=115553 RepID=A0A455UBX3_9GAMM|nr:hypothetical protein HSBAA_31040 [Halomonas sulfidaeris]